MIAKKIQKVLSVLITLCLLAVSVIHVFAGADVPTPQEPTNIIAGNANASAVSATGARAIDNVDEKYATIANSSITAANAAKLTDGITSDGKPTSGADAGTVMVPIAGLGGNSYGGVVYNLGKYYDISEVTTWTINSQKSHVVTEITVFAAKKEEDLYKPASRIGIAALEDAQVPATDAETAEISLSLSEAVTAQYVAIFISNQKGDVAYYSRVTEMEIFGTLSAEQPDLNLFLPDNNLTGKQIVATGIKATDDTFATIQSADYPAAGVYTNLTDGNTSNASDMYGGIPDGGTQIRGVLFDLKGYYDISKISAVLWNAQTGIMVKDVYAFASETLDDLYQSSNQMLTSIGSTDKVRSVEINPVKKVRYVAFFFHAPGSYPRVCELEVYGKARPADEQPAPPPPNILTTEQGIGDPMPYYDPAGKFISAFSIPSYPADDSDPNSEHLPTFASVIKGHSLDGFTDGNTGQSVQIYGGMPDNQKQKGRPVVV